MMANGADEQDFYDEEAERLAFQEAVMEWRKTSAIESQKSESNATENNSAQPKTDSLWHNPFAFDDNDDNDTKPNVAVTKSKVTIIREYIKPQKVDNNSNTINKQILLFDDSDGEETNLKKGGIDEEAEHKVSETQSTLQF